MDNGVFKFLSLIFEEILTVEFDEDLNELINIKSDSFELKWENNSLTKQTDKFLKFDYKQGFDEDFIYLNIGCSPKLIF